MKKALLTLSICLIVIFLSGIKPAAAQMQIDDNIINSPGDELLAQMPMGDDMMGGPEDEMGGPENSPGGPQGMGKGQMGKKGMQGGGPGQFFKKLNLTEDQKAKLKARKQASIQQVKSLREQLKSERTKLMSTLFDPNSSKTDMLSQQEKVNSIQNQMAKVRIESIAYLKGILTAEQKKMLSQIASEGRQKMQNKMNQRKNNTNKPRNARNNQK